MKSILITGYDDAMKEIGDLTSPIMQRYATKHGMDFLCVRCYEDGPHPSWQKLEQVRRLLGVAASYDLVIWLDADTVITNFEFTPPEWSEQPLHASKDWGSDAIEPHHFSMGNFIMYSRCWVNWFWLWDDIQALEEKWSTAPLWEQSAAQEVYRTYSRRGSQDAFFHIHPRRYMNAVHTELAPSAPEPWQPGDWLCHLTGEEITNEKRVAMFHKLREQLSL